MRRVSLYALILCPALASAQVINQGWSPETGFDFSGGAFGKTRTVAYPLRLGLNVTGAPLLPEDANVVSHVYWDGAQLVDTVGNAWTQNGTVPQVAANVSPFVPGKAGAGPYSAANSYQGPTTLGEWQGDWSVTVVWKPTSTTNQYLIGKQNAAQTQGWGCYLGSTSQCQIHDGVIRTTATAGSVTTNSVNVVTMGKSGGTCSIRLNGGSVGTVACGTMTAASAEPIRIGRIALAGLYAVDSTIYEILASTTPYSDALHAARFNAVFGLLPGPVSVTRADPVTYGPVNGFVWSAPPATMGVTASGSEVWKGSTNSALRSETSCVANAVQVPWTLAGSPTCVTDAAVAPDGTTTMDQWTSTGTSDLIFQAVTAASGTQFVGSAWMQKASGTTASLLIQAGTNATSAACGTSDGSACAITGVGTTTVKAAFTGLGTTAVRGWVSATFTSATANPVFYMSPGDYTVATGTTRFWGAQVESGLYPTPYIATTGTATARAATTPSVPMPQIGNRWCISGTITPGSGSTWTTGAGAGSTYLWSTFQGAVANAAWIQMGAGFWNFVLYDSAGASKTASCTHGLGATSSTQRITACNNNGATAIYRNGVLCASGSGAGSALQTATLTPIYLGMHNSGSQIDGSLTNFKVCKGATKASDCR